MRSPFDKLMVPNKYLKGMNRACDELVNDFLLPNISDKAKESYRGIIQIHNDSIENAKNGSDYTLLKFLGVGSCIGAIGSAIIALVTKEFGLLGASLGCSQFAVFYIIKYKKDTLYDMVREKMNYAQFLQSLYELENNCKLEYEFVDGDSPDDLKRFVRRNRTKEDIEKIFDFDDDEMMKGN